MEQKLSLADWLATTTVLLLLLEYYYSSSFSFYKTCFSTVEPFFRHQLNAHFAPSLPSSDINKILVEYHIKNSLYFEKGKKIIIIMKSAQMQTFFY